MSEPESFIARWARRKREATQDVKAPEPPSAPVSLSTDAPISEQQDHVNDVACTQARETAPSAFDITKLPPIDSITADSDIRAFLAPGVPPELTRAALRRAWAADPNIRDFVGLAENAWDFNAPDSMTGFGQLEMTDQLRREVARMVGRALEDGSAERPAPTRAQTQAEPLSIETSAESAGAIAQAPTPAGPSDRGRQIEEGAESSTEHEFEPTLQCSEVPAAAQNFSDDEDHDRVIARRAHGSALPK